METSVVIGSGYGDEGKGLITDFETRCLTAKQVVRFNGGSQAGHTVQTEQARHVFGHVGSGTFAGAATHLTQDFIVNPLTLTKELQELATKGIKPKITVDPRASVSTIFDMAMNGLVELARASRKSDDRHGSCGLGINETVTRHLTGISLSAAQLLDRNQADLELFLRKVRAVWIPYRMKELGITEFVMKNLRDDTLALRYALLEAHVDDIAAELVEKSKSMELGEIDPKSWSLVMEGAQGLALDEEFGAFPYVTRSRTGLINAVNAITQDSRVTPIYVSRIYTTRHGAGPLAFDSFPLDTIGTRPGDATNIPNPWQGTMRFAPLDLIGMINRIQRDLDRAKAVKNRHCFIDDPVIALTCMDQLSEKIYVNVGNELSIMSKEELPHFIQSTTGYKVKYISNGPTHNDIFYYPEGV